MTLSIAIVLIIIAVAIVFFIKEWLPVEVTALSVAVILMITGIITPEEGLSGFSNVGTISVFALLILGIGMQSTGAVNYLGNILESYDVKNELVIVVVMSLTVGIFSAFMNNTAIVAILLPVVVRLSRHANISSSRLLMPLSFAAMVGGSMTVIGTSTNIIVSSIYFEKYGKAFSIFEFTIIGIVFFIAYLLYIITIGRKLLPEKEGSDTLTRAYKLQNYLTEVVVLKNSKLVGKRLDETDLLKRYHVDVVEIKRKNAEVWVPKGRERILAEDTLVIAADLKTLLDIRGKQGLVIRRNVHLDDQDFTSEDAVIFEAVIGQNSFLVGKKIGEVDFLNTFDAIPLAARRSGEPLSQKNLSEMIIQFGDTLLLEARRKNLDRFFNSPDFIVLEKVKKQNLRKGKMRVSTLIISVSILLAAFNVLPLVVAALAGCVALFITGSVSPRYVYRKMEWRVIFLLAGILPLGVAVEKSGTSAWIVQHIIEQFGQISPGVAVSTLFLLTTVLTSFMSNNATAILLAPIAIDLATQLNLDPKPLLVTVMFAASTSFLTPIGYQTNTLIYGPGKYTFMDFFKVGGLLTVIIWILASLIIPYLYF